MKHTYIFKPSEKWGYCGGGAVIVASSWEEVEKIFSREVTGDDEGSSAFVHRSEFTVPDSAFYHWVLVTKIKCAQEEKSRLVFCDYNWA